MPPSIAQLIVEFFMNKEKEMFAVRLSAGLTTAHFGLTGFFGDFVEYFIRSAMGLVLKYGARGIDLGLDRLEAAMKIPAFKDEAKKAWDKASAAVYTEEEKRAIREQYLEIVDRFTELNGPGSWVPDNP